MTLESGMDFDSRMDCGRCRLRWFWPRMVSAGGRIVVWRRGICGEPWRWLAQELCRSRRNECSCHGFGGSGARPRRRARNGVTCAAPKRQRARQSPAELPREAEGRRAGLKPLRKRGQSARVSDAQQELILLGEHVGRAIFAVEVV